MKTLCGQFAATFVLMLALAVPAICWGEIYGWIDGNGVVTYSNLPPPGGVDVTQVIHEDPVSPKAASETAQRVENEALKDRVRLLELEMSRSQRVPVDYSFAPAPPAPAEVGCGPYSYEDCVDWYWVGGRWWPRYGYYRGRERGQAPFAHGRLVAPAHSAVSAGGGGRGR